MQRDKTIQFWDSYHNENDSEEWISKPGEEVLQMIFDQIDDCKRNEDDKRFRCQRRCFTILEIGCGTSTLSRDLKRYIERKNPMVEVVACGTDVSKVCIDVNQKRDCLRAVRPPSAIADNNNNTNNVNVNTVIDKPSSDSRGSLWYEVLNVLDGEPSRKNWDLIIDKGCLDTFVFRSRQRGSHNKNYPQCLRKLLDNLHGWQATAALARPANDVGNDEQCAAQFLPNKIDGNYNLNGDEERAKQHVLQQKQQQKQQPGRITPSVYVWITPRSKLKAVRDYAGFSSVRRYSMPKIYRSKLESRKNNENNKEVAPGGGLDETGNNESGESPDDTCTTIDASSGFMFVCTKNDDYQVGVSMPFPTVSSSSRHTNASPPSDESQCPRCERTFRKFRKDEGFESRGVTYCTRKWKSHCIHCKSDPVVRTNQLISVGRRD